MLCGIIYKHGENVPQPTRILILEAELMGGEKGGWRGVRFEVAEEEPKPEKRGFLSRLFGRKGKKRNGFGGRAGGGAKPAEAVGQEMEPIVLFPQEAEPKRIERAAPVLAELGAEAERFLGSFPNGPRKERAVAAVEFVRKAGNAVVSVDDAVEAIVGYGEGLDGPRGALFTIAFEARTRNFIGKPILDSAETVNVLFGAMGHFYRIINVIKKTEKEEGNGERARGEDRVDALQGIEKVLFSVPPKDRFEALGAIAEIAEGMGRRMCSKDVCRKLAAMPSMMAGRDAMAGLEAVRRAFMAKEAEKRGALPGTSKMRCVTAKEAEEAVRGKNAQNAEFLKANQWIASRMAGAAEIAVLVWNNGRPSSMVEFMWMLERHCGDEDAEREKRHFVMEEAADDCGGPARFRMVDGPEGNCMAEKAAWNVAYFCLPEVCAVASLAQGVEGEEELRRGALRTIVNVALRMPEGRRMEAPGLVLKGVEALLAAGRPRQWVVSDWIAELGGCIAANGGEDAYTRLVWLSDNPMKIFE